MVLTETHADWIKTVNIYIRSQSVGINLCQQLCDRDRERALFITKSVNALRIQTIIYFNTVNLVMFAGSNSMYVCIAYMVYRMNS